VKLREEFPTLRLSRRDRWCWFWCPRSFTITLGLVGLFICGLSPAHWEQIDNKAPGWDDDLWEVLSHELKHLRRWRQLGFLLFVLLYGLIFFPVGLAWGRTWIEREGYLESLRCRFKRSRTDAESAAYREWWVSRFTGGSYGWAWPFKGQVQRWYDTELRRLQQGASRAGSARGSK
jgi:hypothetical protein